MKVRKDRKGFTLAELLIVVAIIGILVAISIPMFSGQLEKARQSTDLSNMRSAKSAAIAEYLSDGSYGEVLYNFDAGKGTVTNEVPEGYGKSRSLVYEGTAYEPLNKYVQVRIKDDVILAYWTDSASPITSPTASTGGSGSTVPGIIPPAGDDGSGSSPDYSAALAAKDNQIQQLQSQLTAASGQISSLQQQIAALQASGSASESTISSLQSQLQQANTARDSLQSQLTALQKDNTDLQEENNRLTAENERLKQELEDLKNQDHGETGPLPAGVKSEDSQIGSDHVVVEVPQEFQGKHINTTFVFDGNVSSSYGYGNVPADGTNTVVLETHVAPAEIYVHATGSDQTKPLKVISVTIALAD